MTITDLNDILREKCRSVFKTRRVSDFYGKRIAIDGNNWMHKYMATAQTQIVNSTDVGIEDPDRGNIVKLWIDRCIQSVCTWYAYGITPVICFDGKHPVKKAQTKTERQQKKENIRQEANQLKENLRKLDLLSRTSDKLEEYRKLLRQLHYVGKHEEELLKSILIGVGVPVIDATGEAEQLCCMLAIEEKVEAVVSRDTDNLAYGCPLLITDFDEQGRDPDGNYYHNVITVGIDDVLAGLQMTFPMFTDMCILLGCDYNSNMKCVGKTRVYNLIKKYGSIDNLPKLDESTILDRKACKCGLPETYKGEKLPYDTQILDYAYCKQQFSYASSFDLINWPTTDTNGEPIERNYTQLMTARNTMAEAARDILNQVDMLKYIPKMNQLYKMLPPPAPLSQETNAIKYPQNIVILKVLAKPAAAAAAVVQIKVPPKLVIVNPEFTTQTQ